MAFETTTQVICAARKTRGKGLPFPNYVSMDGVFERTSGMLPDIVVGTDDGLLVVDAKYYSATNTGNSPKLGDILKQISYLHAVRNVEKIQKVETCFVFPRKEQTEGKYKRVVFTGDDGVTSDAFPDIGCYYFPINRVMTEYVRNQKVLFSDF